jgi:glycosyltransferase involved in cell wall biosynthesis
VVNKDSKHLIEGSEFFDRYLNICDKVTVVARSEIESEEVKFSKNNPIYFKSIRSGYINSILDLIAFCSNVRHPVIIRYPGFVAYAASILMLIMRKKYYLEVVTNPYQECCALASKRYRFLCFFIKQISRFVINNSRLSSFVTRHEIQDDLKVNQAKYRHSYSSINLETFFYKNDFVPKINHPQSSEEITILFVGQLEKNFKRLDLAINLVRNNKNFLLKVVGGGRLLNHYKEISKDLYDQVDFLGAVQNRKELSKIYRECDCMVLTSDREGLPRVVIESMSIGLPVFALKVSGISELLNQECIALNIKDLSIKINQIMMDSAKVEKIISRNLGVAKGFNPQLLQVKRDKFYSEIIIDFYKK